MSIEIEAEDWQISSNWSKTRGSSDQPPTAARSADSGKDRASSMVGAQSAEVSATVRPSYLSVLGGTAYKIGITNDTVEKRFNKDDMDIVKVIKYGNLRMVKSVMTKNKKL